MRIIQKDHNPPTFEFNEVTEEDRARVTAFVEHSGHGTIVNPWEPFLLSFTDPQVIESFRREFARDFDST
ncbi:hypothetical protein JI739_09555 [Ramlibacter sp. AW1]|uniref:Uncharacterized protein n=1 Tax=Ramlibacter aurantiacus TaxID=2801330 RepID=A0A936ZIR2_9BURK|nr:hypothetical protein [Ramlibacter aurantiacus]MBL0420587.1 hypothetical protein [Ramlibacter aurantiacus]